MLDGVQKLGIYGDCVQSSTLPGTAIPVPGCTWRIGGTSGEWRQRYVDQHGVPYLRLTAAAAQATVVMIRRTAIVKGPR